MTTAHGYAATGSAPQVLGHIVPHVVWTWPPQGRHTPAAASNCDCVYSPEAVRSHAAAAAGDGGAAAGVQSQHGGRPKCPRIHCCSVVACRLPQLEAAQAPVFCAVSAHAPAPSLPYVDQCGSA